MNLERLNEIAEYENKGMTLPHGAIPELIAFTRSQLEAQAAATETPVAVAKPKAKATAKAES